MSISRPIALVFRRKWLLSRFWRSASQCWQQQKARAIGLAIFLVVLVLLQLLVQLLLNLWNRNFFDALGRRDAHTLWIQAQLFIPLAAMSIVLASASVWGRMTAQRNWREALTRKVMVKWLENDRFRHLDHLAKGSENPEYRIAFDIRMATDAPIDFAVALLSSVLTLITFFTVLWTIGGSIEFVLLGVNIVIPGYLMFGVILYAVTVSGFMLLFGRHLTGVVERMNQAEAEFRSAIDAFGKETANPEASAGDSGERTLQLKLQAVLLWWRETCAQLVRTTIVSHGNTLLAPVVGWLLCVPKYLSGAMSLGELTQAAAAFVVLQGAFNWLVDNYQRVADWRASAHRVATLLVAIDELEAKERLESSRQK
jgi:vitamin B12/bleomycin/antimicrobial peptide transport system ATP-binding/permease protein